MDHKPWPWKKKSTEKTIISDDKSSLSSTNNENETLVDYKAQVERDLKFLTEKLSSALSECTHKDDFARKQAKIAQEAIAGWEKTEGEALSLKQELDKALQQQIVSEERLVHLDAALKECMQQLRFVREEQEKRIHDAIIKTSKECESTRISLDLKLAEAWRRISTLDGENAQLSEALLVKEKVIEELNKHRAQTEADLSSLITRLESTEKENATLKYEVRVLEKELEIRNEEREFNRRTADVAHKQHLESVKKIAKMESECQRLRVLVRKRLPGPAALAKMKNEVDMLGRNQPETRRRKSNPSPIGSMDFSEDISPDSPTRKINFLTEQLCLLEEENRSLKQAFNNRMNEIQSSAATQAQVASSFSQLGQLGGHVTAEPVKNIRPINEMPSASISDMGSDDKASCAESWASALISELEHFKNGKLVHAPFSRSVGASDMNLMDDFVEMEKLAVVSAENRFGRSDHTAETDVIHYPLRTQSSEYVPEVAGAATVPARNLYNLSVDNHPKQPKKVLTSQVPSHFEGILKMVLDQSQVLQLNPLEVLDEIKAALVPVGCPDSQNADSRESIDDADAAQKNISQVSPLKSLKEDLTDKETGSNIYTAKKSSPKLQSNMSKSIHKIVELIEGISIPPPDDCNAEMLTRKEDGLLQYKNSENPTGYIGRVFQWKASELSSSLRQFVQTCNDLLNGKSDIESFTEQLACTLEWIMNHCFSLQDVSSMKDAIRSFLDWDESRSESEVDSGTINPISESNKTFLPREELLPMSPLCLSYGHDSNFELLEVGPTVKEVLPSNKSAENDMEERSQSEVLKNESLNIQHQEPHKTIDGLRMEVVTLKHTKEKTLYPNEIYKKINEDLETQLIEAKNELKEACEKLVYVGSEFDNNEHSCQQLEGTYHDMLLPLQSMSEKGAPDDIADNRRELRTDWEIVAASEKLAECQETILNLGKQLKALASPREAALFDRFISSPSAAHNTVATLKTPEKNTHQRTSLLDKMRAEDKTEIKDLNSPKAEVIILNGNGYSAIAPNRTECLESFTSPNGVNQPKDEGVVGSMAIVPSKKKGSGGLLKKLLHRRKKGSC